MDDQTIFKSLRKGGLSPYQSYQWPVPNRKAGAWVEAKGKLVSCQNGVHVARGPQILGWLQAELYLAEFDGEMIDAGDKLVCRKARLVEQLNWNPRIACAFAVDCADRVLSLFEKQRPGDDRPRRALDAATAWVKDPSKKTANDAANAAAYAAKRQEKDWQYQRLVRWLTGELRLP